LIPHPIASLKGLTVLVTRPAEQAVPLCELIKGKGGNPIALPTIAIESVAQERNTVEYDWLIFVSANAVRHGLPLVKFGTNTRIAAIGKATAAALAAQDIAVDAMPISGTTSESLLAHPAFAAISGQRVLIVKGIGGRELLHDALSEKGATVSTLSAYRRVQPLLNADQVQQIEQKWRDEGIDIVTITSVETLDNLLAMLSDSGRALLNKTPFVTLSERIAIAARDKGLSGTCVLSRGADDEAIVGAIAAWHARAR
jgi:uroporphyrinogen-III synthase